MCPQTSCLGFSAIFVKMVIAHFFVPYQCVTYKFLFSTHVIRYVHIRLIVFEVAPPSISCSALSDPQLAFGPPFLSAVVRMGFDVCTRMERAERLQGGNIQKCK